MKGRARVLGSLLIAVAALFTAGATTPALVAIADPGLSFSIANVGPKDGGGEPSIAIAPNGKLFVSYPGNGMDFFRSLDRGKTWVPGKNKADTASGDTCVTTDQSGAVYQCNLAGTAETAPLQADVFKSLNDGDNWVQGAAFVSGGTKTCGLSCNPFGVDRQWTTAWIPPGKTTAQARVALMYHDFYGPSQIWVNVSNDGGATYGPPTAVLANPALTPTGLTGAGQAQFFTICNSIPTNILTATGGAHPGRIYVSWIAADPAQNAAGCNISEAETFHTLWVAWSDDGGATWTPQLAFDGGIGHDASTPFTAFALDNQGNPYIAFADNLNSTPACSVAPDTSCEYDMYVVWSPDGGTTWQGGNGPTGALPTPGTPFKVSADTGTHWFPAIAASNPGEVQVAYLRSETIIATDPLGKATPGGGRGAHWNLYAAQTRNLNAANPASVTWARTRVTPVDLHIGDICNLGIACIGPAGSNRNLLDFIQMVSDASGCAHVAYTDDNKSVGIRSANQTGGCLRDAPASSPASLPSPPSAAPEGPAPLPNTAAGGARLARVGGTAGVSLLGLVLLATGAALVVRRRRGPNI